MSPCARRLLAAAVFFLTLGALGAQNLKASGTATGADPDSARSAAISKALDKAFAQKDALFRRLFVSDLGLYGTMDVKVEGTPAKNPLTGEVTVTVMVEVDSTALAAIQSRYTEAVSALLTEAEKELESVNTLLETGSAALKKEAFSQSWNYFSEAQTRSGAVLRQLEAFKDDSIRSDKSVPKSVIQQLAQLRMTQAEEALTRLREIEKAALQGKSQSDLFEAYSAFEASQLSVEDWVSRKLSESPFYDVPAETLQKHLLEWESQTRTLADLDRQYSRLEALAGTTSLLFQARLAQAKRELEDLRGSLGKIRSDLEAELREPKISRVEKERQSKIFWSGVRKALAEGASAALLRDSGEVGAFRFFFPLQVQGGRPELTNLLPLSAKLEGRYAGLWLMTRFDWSARETFDLQRKNSSMTQTVAAGFGEPWIFGAGYQWDWRRVSTRGIFDDPVALASRSRVHGFFGLVDPELSWALWMLDGWYEIPGEADRKDAGAWFNLGVDGVLRFGRWVKVEAGAFSRTLGTTGPSLDREAGFHAGAGFKLPNPLLWGVRYESSTLTRLSDTAQRSQSVWEFYLEYSF